MNFDNNYYGYQMNMILTVLSQKNNIKLHVKLLCFESVHDVGLRL